MGILKKIEKRLEIGVEGLFARGFKSKVEPVELGKKMALAMINNKVVALKKTWAPNEFEVFLSPEDDEQYESYKKELIGELKDFLVKEAAAEGLKMMGRPRIVFTKNERFKRGQFHIDVHISEDLKKEISEPKENATQLIPIEEQQLRKSMHFIQLQPSMVQYDLKEGKTVLGRSATNDISIADPSLSRHHVEIYIREKEAVLKDLGSTNGTKVNGKMVKSTVLRNKDVIEAGETRLIYRRSNA